MVISWWSFLLIASASQCIFLLALFALKKGGNKKAKVIISAMLIVCLAINFNNILYATDLFLKIRIAGFARGMLLFLGPLFYFYSKAISQPQFVLRPKLLLHFVPYLLAVVSLVMEPPPSGDLSELLERFKEGTLPITASSIVRFEAYMIHILVYLFLARREFLRMENSMDRDFTISLKSRKSWLQQITIFLFLLVLTLLYFTGYMVSTGFYTLAGNFTITLVTSAFVYFIAFKSILASQQVLPEFQVRNVPQHFKNERKGAFVQSLQELIEGKKIFKNADLKLADVAGQLGVGSHVLSTYINQELGTGFFEWINGYRIREFIYLAQDGAYKNYSISGIAAEVGFKSKSSFYTAFKKAKGMTPSQYLKNTETPPEQV